MPELLTRASCRKDWVDNLKEWTSLPMPELLTRASYRKDWVDNLKEWTSLPMPELLTRASYRKDWKGISAELFLNPPTPVPPTTQSVKGLN